jgi:osmotically-inducible protein OsmY
MLPAPQRPERTRACFPRYHAERVMFDNGVVGKPAGSGSMTDRRMPTRSDDELLHDTQQALLEEPGVPRDVTVRVVNGRITLRFVVGVRDFDNHIAVKPVISASNIKRHVLEELQAELMDEAVGVQVHVQDTHVTITGNARSVAERRCIENSVRSAPGVQTVDNQLRVPTL